MDSQDTLISFSFRLFWFLSFFDVGSCARKKKKRLTLRTGLALAAISSSSALELMRAVLEATSLPTLVKAAAEAARRERIRNFIV